MSCAQGHQDAELFAAEARLEEALGVAGQTLPTRRVDTDMTPYSKVSPCWWCLLEVLLYSRPVLRQQAVSCLQVHTV